MAAKTTDRTDEMYAQLRAGRRGGYGKTLIVLDAGDVVASPTQPSRFIHGPAVIRVEQWPDGGIDMHVDIRGKIGGARTDERFKEDGS